MLGGCFSQAGIGQHVDDFSLLQNASHLTLCLFLSRFEIEIEPIFASLALYDVKEKKKVGFFLITLHLSEGITDLCYKIEAFHFESRLFRRTLRSKWLKERWRHFIMNFLTCSSA